MKNKVLLTLLIVFIVMTGIWITSGTIFVVCDIEIMDLSTEVITLSEDEKTHIANETDLFGKNILFSVNQSDIKSKIKNCDDTLKVQSVKASFPNKIVIEVTRRVPVYFVNANNNQCCYDADMCILRDVTPTNDCVDISGTNLSLSNGTASGDEAVGIDTRNNLKIKQLKSVAKYFSDMKGFTIAYDETLGNGDPYLRMVLTIQEDPSVRLILCTEKEQDFDYLLAYTYTFYQGQRFTGDYHAMYNNHGKVVIDSNGGKYSEK